MRPPDVARDWCNHGDCHAWGWKSVMGCGVVRTRSLRVAAIPTHKAQVLWVAASSAQGYGAVCTKYICDGLRHCPHEAWGQSRYAIGNTVIMIVATYSVYVCTYITRHIHSIICVYMNIYNIYFYIYIYIMCTHYLSATMDMHMLMCVCMCT